MFFFSEQLAQAQLQIAQSSHLASTPAHHRRLQPVTLCASVSSSVKWGQQQRGGERCQWPGFGVVRKWGFRSSTGCAERLRLPGSWTGLRARCHSHPAHPSACSAYKMLCVQPGPDPTRRRRPRTAFSRGHTDAWRPDRETLHQARA